MKKILIAAFLVLLPMICPSARAAEVPTGIIVASEEWEDATNKDGTGLYWDILRAVYEPLGIKLEYMIRSYNGAVNLAKSRKVDAAVGSYINEVDDVLYPSHSFDQDVVAVVFKNGKCAQWQGRESLRGKTVAWIKGYSYEEYLKVPVVKHEFSEREDILRALENDRIDFFMDAQADIEPLLENGSIDAARYRMETVMELDLYFIFADNERGMKFKEIFDEQFPALAASGELQKLLEKWNW
ncbi:MAG: transporter substrate-binding domain-containing protein [Deltaproteobacteria bacterium]|nr:transporter substrate-binding domain-containing protein [Deltaproteobacteria bacterium]